MKTRSIFFFKQKRWGYFVTIKIKKETVKWGYKQTKNWNKKIFECKTFNVETYSTNLRGGKSFAGEHKIQELKKTLLRSKYMVKFKGKRIKPKELIKKATFNANNRGSAKFGYSPQQIEE